MTVYVLTDASDAQGRPVILLHRFTAMAKRWHHRWHLIGQWDARDRETAMAVRADLIRKAQP